MKKIRIKNNKFALVDDDYAFLRSYKWHLHPGGYAKTRIYFGKEKSSNLYMHQIVMGRSVNKKYEIDHIDGNPLNNQKSNLRFVTHRQNNSNNKIHRDKTKTSKYVGVSKRDTYWYAHMRINGKSTHLGCFKDEYKAHEKYKEKLEEIERKDNILD